MKNLITLFIVVLGISFASAQDEAIFGHYYINPILINPSTAGFSDYHHLQMNLRNQWTGFSGAPATYMVSYNGPIGKVLGVGLGVLTENIAQMTRFRVNMNYAFRYRVNKMKFAFGFSTEFQNLKLASSVYDQGNSLYEPGDYLVENAVDGLRVFDASLAGYATFDESTYFGMSFPNLIKAKLDAIETGAQTESSYFRYYIFHLGHKFRFDNYNFTLDPSIMIRKILDVPFQVDFNVMTGFLDEKVQAGLSYRSGVGGAVGLMLGTKLDPFAAYYSYDVSFQGFQQYNNGTHEVTVSFDFAGKEQKKNGKK